MLLLFWLSGGGGGCGRGGCGCGCDGGGDGEEASVLTADSNMQGMCLQIIRLL
jgi:hypothetical protein